MAHDIPNPNQQHALARNRVSSILNAAGHWIEPETGAEIVNAVLAAQTNGQQPDPTTADDPTPLRWGLGDVLHGDDDTVTVCLSGPNREPYWLQLDPERTAALREDLAGPLSEPQDHPGADLFEILLRAGLGPDVARERMYAYAAMVIRQHQALHGDSPSALLTAESAAPWSDPNADIIGDVRSHIDEISGKDQTP